MTNETTNKLAKVENGVLRINADVFIIPNSATTPSECGYWKDKRRRQMQQILAETTGDDSAFNDDEIVILQTWTVAEETLDTESLGDHGGLFIGEDGKEHIIPNGRIGEFFPAKIFADHKEGEVVEVKIPKGYDKFNADFDVVLNLKLSQKGYRYGRFGNFETVFEQVARSKMNAASRMSVGA